MKTFLLDMLRIRRVEFLIAEIPILAVPLLYSVDDLSVMKTGFFWESVALFFLLFNFGDLINCLADRELDAVYKKHLSQAVYRLGVRFVAIQVVVTAAVCVGLAMHLSWLLQRWLVLGMVLLGLGLGAAYSVPPLRLKSGGVWQVPCLWLIIFVGPMLLIAALFAPALSPALVLLSAAYGMLQIGIILVNTAEDYPEDLDAGVRTTIVELGLAGGIGLAAVLVLAGGVGLLGVLGWSFWQRQVSALLWSPLLAVTVAWVLALAWTTRLWRQVAASDRERGIARVKAEARLVPLWLTLVAWSTFGCALVLQRA